VIYRCFDLTIQSDLPLNLDACDDVPDCVVRRGLAQGQKWRPLLRLPAPLRLPSWYELFQDDDRFLVRLAQLADFQISGNEIRYEPCSGASDESVGDGLLGLVFGLWLELREVTVLHGCAVQVDGQAIAFLGGSGVGKSTLLLEMVSRGHKLVADDQVVITSRGRDLVVAPTTPWIKALPDSFVRVGMEPAKLPHVLPAAKKHRWHLPAARRARKSGALRQLVILRRDSRIQTPTLLSVRPAQALELLLKNSLIPRAAQSAGIGALRLRRLASVVQSTDVCRMDVPTSLDRLGEARDLILGRLNSGFQPR